jgi:protein O-GlcNAc transferase
VKGDVVIKANVASIAVSIQGGVKICVAPDPRSLTTYVLLEQEDWFEQEMAFIRAFVQP